MKSRTLAALAGSLLAVGCSSIEGGSGVDSNLVVATSTIVEDVVRNVGGESLNLVSLIPNGFDSHTYEPKPSEIEMLGSAKLVVMADAGLNQKITQLAELSTDSGNILDLNASSLSSSDFIVKASSSRANPHTWTDPTLVAKWVPTIVEELVSKKLVSRAVAEANAASYLAKLSELDRKIAGRFSPANSSQRRLVVYHDAWEYFAKRYDLELVGVLQAVDFAEPSAADLLQLTKDIKTLGVRVFFGSEVFPSEVLEALERESGARYVPDLADDRLPGSPGDEVYGYIPLMERNVDLLTSGLFE